MAYLETGLLLTVDKSPVLTLIFPHNGKRARPKTD